MSQAAYDEDAPLTPLPADQILDLLGDMQDTLDEIREAVHRLSPSEEGATD